VTPVLAVFARSVGLVATAAAAACTGTPTPDVPAGTSTAAELPVPRSEVAGARWGDRIVVAGGFLRDGESAARVDAWTADDGWQRLPDLPQARNHPGLAVFGDRLYLVGGYDNGGRASRVVWSLGNGEIEWRTEPPLPEPRAAAAVIADGTRLVAAGGVVDRAVSASVAVFDGEQWVAGPPLSAAREHLAGAATGGRIYAVAGRTGGLAGNLDVVESLGAGETAWRREPSLPEPRGGTAADAVGGVCVAGGEDPQGTEPRVVCLRDGGWTEAGRLTEPRHGLAVVALDGRLHVIAGGPRPGLTVSGTHEVLAVD
jgi:hypothetical protein